MSFCGAERKQLDKMVFSVLLLAITTIVLVKGCPTGIAEGSGISILNQQQFLDPNEKFLLQWETNLKLKRITFTITAETLGYIGFGMSPNGGMDGADMAIGGVHPDGFSYISDRIGVGNALPKVDKRQNWELLEASENGTHTMIKLGRPFETCDAQDLKIENGTSTLIWALGQTDDITYHGSIRGTSSALLLDPPQSSPILADDVKVWRMNTELEMPANETTYWCTVKKFPKLETKHHIIGFEPYMPSAAALAHSHHFIVRECIHPEGKDLSPLLDPLVVKPGGPCYRDSNTVVATDGSQYCKAYVFVWAVGGKRTTFPENIGFPIGDGRTSEYYMLEIHLNNPKYLSGIKMDTGLNIFYTPTLREHDASTLIVGHEVSVAQTIPPKTKRFVTVGHCSTHCTEASLPKTGINVFNILLHSHNAGRQVKLRHFRNGTELPWMSYDDFYHFDYQQNRQLSNQIQVLPGDQISYECTYDTSKRSGVTIGGYSSEEEMCQAVLMFYPKIDLEMCSSTFPRDDVLQHFGIDEIISKPNVGDPIVSLPTRFRGKRYTEVLNDIEWTAHRVKDLQEELRFSYHRGVCSSRPARDYDKMKTDLPLKWYIPNVSYVPISAEYSPPPSSCAEN